MLVDQWDDSYPSSRRARSFAASRLASRRDRHRQCADRDARLPPLAVFGGSTQVGMVAGARSGAAVERPIHKFKLSRTVRLEGQIARHDAGNTVHVAGDRARTVDRL